MRLRVTRSIASVLAFVFCTGVGVVACTSPTLPLPPPALPTIVVGTTPDTFVLKSDKGALPNALVIVVNRNEALPRSARVAGTLADAVGSWELSIRGAPGDVVDISQESDTTRSPSTSATLR